MTKAEFIRELSRIRDVNKYVAEVSEIDTPAYDCAIAITLMLDHVLSLAGNLKKME